MRRTPAPPLTAQILRALFNYDTATGVFTSKRKTAAKHIGDPVGTRRKDGYLELYVDGIRHLAHRLAFLHVIGVWPSGQIDHINGKRDDNRLANLRDVSPLVNVQNTRNVSRGTRVCLKLGAERHGKRFRARIKVEGRLIAIGTFATEDEAHLAYLEAKRAHHVGCTI